MFPQGAPGFALILLRLSVALTFFENVLKIPGVSASEWLKAVVFLASALLSLGVLTPVFAILACAASVAGVLMAGQFNEWMMLRPLLEAAALALLGPGAYSVDAWLFGRRVLVIPPDREP